MVIYYKAIKSGHIPLSLLIFFTLKSAWLDFMWSTLDFLCLGLAHDIHLLIVSLRCLGLSATTQLSSYSVGYYLLYSRNFRSFRFYHRLFNSCLLLVFSAYFICVCCFPSHTFSCLHWMWFCVLFDLLC